MTNEENPDITACLKHLFSFMRDCGASDSEIVLRTYCALIGTFGTSWARMEIAGCLDQHFALVKELEDDQ